MIALGNRNLVDLRLGTRPVFRVMKGDDLVWERKPVKYFRYIKDTLRGNTVNNYNHWVEIQAISDGVNVALNKVATLSVGRQNGSTPISVITDGSKNTMIYFDGGHGEATIILDLGQVYPIEELKIWHFYADRRHYSSHLEVSEDKRTWDTLYNSNGRIGYRETSRGQTYKF